MGNERACPRPIAREVSVHKDWTRWYTEERLTDLTRWLETEFLPSAGLSKREVTVESKLWGPLPGRRLRMVLTLHHEGHEILCLGEPVPENRWHWRAH